MAIKKRKLTNSETSQAPLTEKEDSFIKAVDSDANDSKPWEAFDPNEKFVPRKANKGQHQKGSAINLKLNRYEYEMLKHVAQKESRSLHRQVKHTLMSGLEAAIKETS